MLKIVQMNMNGKQHRAAALTALRHYTTYITNVFFCFVFYGVMQRHNVATTA
jgi:hypothetical protein